MVSGSALFRAAGSRRCDKLDSLADVLSTLTGQKNTPLKPYLPRALGPGSDDQRAQVEVVYRICPRCITEDAA